jgi:type IV secretion system protein VirB11
MTVALLNEEISLRNYEDLTMALGPAIAEAMADKTIVEIMANPDGKIWIDRSGEGQSFTGHTITPAQAESVLRVLAHAAGVVVTKDTPRVSAALPRTGERFQGEFMPIVTAPTFCIRKRPEVVFGLDDYVERGVISQSYAQALRQAVDDRQNIVIAGGTGSGKTTLLNAILAEPGFAKDRIVTIEDTPELQCVAPNRVAMLTSEASNPPITMGDLVFDVLRMRPDRIIGGEVRKGDAALNLLKAWNTGHPGGCTTIHANGVYEVLTRFEDLIGEVSARIPYRAISQAINVIVFIERTREGRKVTAMSRVTGYENNSYILADI